MNRIRSKLNSGRGASLLIALLFFLLCGMVGATVLAAAASNGGKIRGRKEEQQDYFACTSALRLICERLEKATYTAKIKVTEVGADDSGVVHTPPDATCIYVYKKYEQSPGVLSLDSDDTKNGEWNAALPILKELDWLFSETVPKAPDPAAGEGESEGDDVYIPLSGTNISEPATTGHDLTIKLDALPSGSSLTDGDVKSLQNPVVVNVCIGAGDNDIENYRYWLYLKVTDSAGNVLMKAEMEPKTDLPDAHTPGVLVTDDDGNPVLDAAGAKQYVYTLKWNPARIHPVD